MWEQSRISRLVYLNSDLPSSLVSGMLLQFAFVWLLLFPRFGRSGLALHRLERWVSLYEMRA